MAKIVTEFDTQEKTMKVTIDGVTVENVTSASFYNYYNDEGKFSACISTQEEVEEGGMSKYTSICASLNGKDEVKTETEEDIKAGVLSKLLFPKR